MYVNDDVQHASERIQPVTLIEIARSITSPVDWTPLGKQSGPEMLKKGHAMFRKIAIALVAASVFTAPALAQSTTPSDTSSPTTSVTPQTEKSITKVTKHRVVGRHHRHSTKMAKFTKSHGKVKYAKYGKYTHPMKHGKSAKLMSGARASVKSIPPKALTKPRSSKPGAKPSLD